MALHNRVFLREYIVAGVAAWLALNAFAYAAAPLFGISFGTTASFFGSFLLPGAGAKVQLWAGRVVFFGAALGWALLYGLVAPRLSGPGWFRGLVFGTGIWVASALLLPLFGYLHPLSAGFGDSAFGLIRAPFPGLIGLGFRGVSGVALSVLAHQTYGVTLGALTDPRGEVPAHRL